MPKVYIPQQPARFDHYTRTWTPTANLKPAERWGEPVVMFPQAMSNAPSGPVIDAMRERMRDFAPDDIVCAVGDPVLIAAAACLAARATGGLVRILKWDRQAHDYILVEFKQ